MQTEWHLSAVQLTFIDWGLPKRTKSTWFLVGIGALEDTLSRWKVAFTSVIGF